jgi:hypothetical protein
VMLVRALPLSGPAGVWGVLGVCARNVFMVTTSTTKHTPFYRDVQLLITSRCICVRVLRHMKAKANLLQRGGGLDYTEVRQEEHNRTVLIGRLKRRT